MNKKITLLITLMLGSNTHSMWSSKTIIDLAAASQPAIANTCGTVWSKIKNNKGYIGASIALAGLIYGGIKVYNAHQPCDIRNLHTGPEGHILQVIKTPCGSLIFASRKPNGEENDDCINDSQLAENDEYRFVIGKITRDGYRPLSFHDDLSTADLIVIKKSTGRIITTIENIQDLV